MERFPDGHSRSKSAHIGHHDVFTVSRAQLFSLLPHVRMLCDHSSTVIVILTFDLTPLKADFHSWFQYNHQSPPRRVSPRSVSTRVCNIHTTVTVPLGSWQQVYVVLMLGTQVCISAVPLTE
jgi:hypothetical protein